MPFLDPCMILWAIISLLPLDGNLETHYGELEAFRELRNAFTTFPLLYEDHVGYVNNFDSVDDGNDYPRFLETDSNSELV
jgi:hypothetical protein